MTPKIPALNEVRVQTGTHEPVYPDEPEGKRYMILYPEDYEGHGVDVEGNVALLLNRENAQEVKRLAENIIRDLDGEHIGGCPTCGATSMAIEKADGEYQCQACGAVLDGENDA